MQGDDDVFEKFRSTRLMFIVSDTKPTMTMLLIASKTKNRHSLMGLRSTQPQLINAIYESIETGKEVFLRFNPKKSRLGRSS